jgi:hypothetical protein
VLLLDDSYVVAASIEATRIAAQREPATKLHAEVLAEGVVLGLYDRSDIADWALGIVEREAEPPIWAIDLAMGSRLDNRETAELLRSVPGHVAPEAVLEALVGVIAKGVASGRLDELKAGGFFYTLCRDVTGELQDLADFDAKRVEQDGDGFRHSLDGLVAALQERLRPLERFAAGVPLPRRFTAGK